jgi:hypothetical protein
MTDERWVRISSEQAEWLRIAAKRMAFDESLLASTAILLEIADAHANAPRTRLAALLARGAPAEQEPVEPAVVAEIASLREPRVRPAARASEDASEL